VDGERRILTPRVATCTSFDGVPIVYETAGSRGPVLVFIHGWSCGRAFWREQTALADAFRVIALDLAGHGASADASARRAWSMIAFARDVEAVIAAAGVDDVVLVGHSMGGAVAVETALLLGDRCRLVLGIDTFTDERFYGGRPAAEIAERCAAFRDDFAGTMTRMVEQITAPATDRATVRWIADAMAATRVDDAIAALGALLAWNAAARWPQLACPVATINCAMLESPEHAIALAGLRLHLMDGVGHFPMLEAPARFNAALRALLTTRA
jgi:pimeloyl-ACP methyl ester carboxylesterase